MPQTCTSRLQILPDINDYQISRALPVCRGRDFKSPSPAYSRFKAAGSRRDILAGLLCLAESQAGSRSFGEAVVPQLCPVGALTGAGLCSRADLLCRVSLQTALCWLCSCSSAARAPTAPQAPPDALAQRDQTRDDFLLAQGILEWAGRDLKPHPAMAGTARSVPGCPAPVSIPGTLQGSELLWRNLCSPGMSRTPQSCIPWTWGGSGVLSSSTCPSWALLVVGWSLLPAATRGLSTCDRNSMALWDPEGCSR